MALCRIGRTTPRVGRAATPPGPCAATPFSGLHFTLTRQSDHGAQGRPPRRPRNSARPAPSPRNPSASLARTFPAASSTGPPPGPPPCRASNRQSNTPNGRRCRPSRSRPRPGVRRSRTSRGPRRGTARETAGNHLQAITRRSCNRVPRRVAAGGELSCPWRRSTAPGGEGRACTRPRAPSLGCRC